MTGRNPDTGQTPWGNDPLGMSKFSPRRNTVKITICLILIIGLLAGATIQANMIGGARAAAIPLAGLTAGVIIIYILVRVSVRTVQGEIWIRRMGTGDLEYRVEPTGNDEITKVLEALETLRQSSIRAIQLDRVQQLSDELQQKNQELETALEELRRTQDRIISQQKLAELGELAAGVAHEIRNPLQFVRNFAISSGMLIDDLEALLEQPDGFDREEARDIMRDILDNMERMTHHSDGPTG